MLIWVLCLRRRRYNLSSCSQSASQPWYGKLSAVVITCRIVRYPHLFRGSANFRWQNRKISNLPIRNDVTNKIMRPSIDIVIATKNQTTSTITCETAYSRRNRIKPTARAHRRHPVFGPLATTFLSHGHHWNSQNNQFVLLLFFFIITAKLSFALCQQPKLYPKKPAWPNFEYSSSSSEIHTSFSPYSCCTLRCCGDHEWPRGALQQKNDAKEESSRRGDEKNKISDIYRQQSYKK